MIKENFFLKAAAFFLVVFLLSVFIEAYLDDSNFPQFNELSESLGNNTEIIYFGDSTMRWTGLNDTDKRPIGDMLRDILGNVSVSVISNNAYHLGIYEEFSKYICSSEIRPKLVIFPINLRSFSPEWDTRPQYQFNDQIEQIKSNNNPFLNLWKRFSRVFGGEKEGDDEIAWKNQIVYFNTTPAGKVIDYNFQMTEKDPDIEEKIKKKFIYHYLYNLDFSHRKIASLNNTIKNYKNCGIKLLIYITPIDYQAGLKYIGPAFTGITKHNIEIVLATGNQNGQEIKNLAVDLGSEFFTYALNPSEHLDQSGRRHISEVLAKEIKGSQYL